MRKYIHYKGFTCNPDVVLTDNDDESGRGYDLYAEIEAEDLDALVKDAVSRTSVTIDGERIDTSADVFVAMLNSSLRRPEFHGMNYSLVLHHKDCVTETVRRRISP